MEQADQPHQSSLKFKRQEAPIRNMTQDETRDIASMRDIIEFLAELKDAQEEEWREVGYDGRASAFGDRIERGMYSDTLKIYSSKDYTYYRDYPEGQYTIHPQSSERLAGSHIWVEENCLDTILRLLTRMMEGVARGRYSYQDPINVLSSNESHTLFFNLSIYAGFYNFIPNHDDRADRGKRAENPSLEQITLCERVFSQLGVLPTLTEEEWGKLRGIANFRVRDRLRYQYYMRENGGDWGKLVQAEGVVVANTFKYRDLSQYSYPKYFQLEQIDALVNEVVIGEERRLRECIDKLYVPLFMLVQQKTTRKRKIVERVTSPEGFLQSLQELLHIGQAAPRSAVKTSVVEGTLTTDSAPVAKVKNVEHKGQSYIYHIELTDPDILPKACEFTVTYNQDSEVDDVSLQEVDEDE